MQKAERRRAPSRRGLLTERREPPPRPLQPLTGKMAAESTPTTLLTDLHVSYIQSLDQVSAAGSTRGFGSTFEHVLTALSLAPLRSQNRDELSYYYTEHLRMNGVYWGLTALALMNRQDALPREEMIKWVMSCYVDQAGPYELSLPTWENLLNIVALFTGGFAPHPNHDPNVHATLSAVQILAMQDSLETLDRDRIVECEHLALRHAALPCR